MQCFQKADDVTFVQTYCHRNFKDHALKSECARREQFCYMCCDVEIGLLSLGNLDCCYNRCDAFKSPQNPTCDTFLQ